MTIAESYKQVINNAFANTIFLKRDNNVILKTLLSKVRGSDSISIIPPTQKVKIENIDDTHDRVTFEFDDYAFDGVITWKIRNDKMNIVFINIE